MHNNDKDLEEFKALLVNNKHYSEALVNFLIKKLDSNCKHQTNTQPSRPSSKSMI